MGQLSVCRSPIVDSTPIFETGLSLTDKAFSWRWQSCIILKMSMLYTQANYQYFLQPMIDWQWLFILCAWFVSENAFLACLWLWMWWHPLGTEKESTAFNQIYKKLKKITTTNKTAIKCEIGPLKFHWLNYPQLQTNSTCIKPVMSSYGLILKGHKTLYEALLQWWNHSYPLKLDWTY